MMLRRYLTIIITAVMLSLPASVAAITADDQDALDNDTIHYIENETCTTGSTDSDSNVAVTLVGSDNMTKIWNFLISKGLQSYQAAGIMGNLASESASFDPGAQQNGSSSTTPIANVGFGIVQWTSAGRQQALVAYAAAMQPPQAVNTLEAQLPFMWHELNSSDFIKDLGLLQAATDVASATRAIMVGDKSSIRGYEAPADQSEAAIQNRIATAQKIYNLMTGGGTGTTPSAATTTSSCSGTGGAVQGSITSTAKGAYTWPTPSCTQTADGETRASCQDARAAYKTDIVNPNGVDSLTDCGTFVATVMRKSGVDANYPVVSTSVQIAYLRAHPEKYQITENPTSTGQLKPGDILIYSNGSEGHTMIYMGQTGGAYPRADASLHDHTPQMNTPGGITWIMGFSNMLAATAIN